MHHGGAGTTEAAFGAGVPQFVVPFFADQPFWGWRVAATGVGPTPIHRRKLTVASLETALRNATSKPSYRQAAMTIGSLIAGEDALAEATRVITTSRG